MMQANATHAAQLRIDASHPALPGHFPGRPVVPGVVVLDHVLQSARAWLGHTLTLHCLSQAKFMAPLLPDEQAQVDLRLQPRAAVSMQGSPSADNDPANEDGTAELRFAVTRAGATIAQGTMIVAHGPRS